MPRKPRDYTKARVYKLINDIDDTQYIGSCCTTLPKRLYEHKHMAGTHPHVRVYKHLQDIGGITNTRIILLEKCDNVSNEEELRKREQYYIDECIKIMGRDKCLNSCKAHAGIDWEDPDRKKVH